MKHILLIGGNGYIGQAFAHKVLNDNTEIQLYIVSRSGTSSIQDARVHNISADFTENEPVLVGLPEKIDCIVNFIGRPEKDMEQLKKFNQVPVDNMIKLAEKYQINLLGFIGGVLGPKSFVAIKAEMIQKLKETGKNVFYVEPTVVYGRGRNDGIAKMIPMFKFLGHFWKGLKPVHVDKVVSELVAGLNGIK